MAKVKQSYVGTLNGGTTIGIQLPILVNSGADGSYVIAANQIAWGESEFNNNKFDGTTEGLLTAIETAIANKTVDLSNYTTYSYVTTYATTAASAAASNAVKNHENTFGHITDTERVNLQSAYEVAYFAYNRINTFLDGEGVKDEVIETLKEIQDYISYDVAGAATMVNNIAAAQTRADNAYSYASQVGAVADSAAVRAEQAYTNAAGANDRAGEAYTYASQVGAVADGAASTAAQAYANAGNAYDHASAAYTYASQVGAVADDAASRAEQAYAYAHSAYSYAAAVGAVADNALTKAGEALSYAESSNETLNNRINEIIEAGIDKDAVNGIIGDYLKDTDLSTDISYTVAFAASETGYFISGVTVTREGAGNDYGFAFTYSYIPSPKAEDYWEEYVPAE
jgi:hypothetical protein